MRTQAGCHAANGRVGRGDKGVGAKVQVQHGCVGALDQDAAASVMCVVDVGDGVANKGANLVGVCLVAADIRLNIVILRYVEQ